jgi:hypothetical protein
MAQMLLRLFSSIYFQAIFFDILIHIATYYNTQHQYHPFSHIRTSNNDQKQPSIANNQYNRQAPTRKIKKMRS